MRGMKWLLVALLLSVAVPGCGGGPSKRTLASSEPALLPPGESEPPMISRAKPVATPSTVSVVDRHPLLSKPRDYYENTGSNKVAKTAAAAFIGVPVGIFGELKQIVVGTPANAP